MKPLVIDLFCGLGGFSEGFIAEGYEAVGFDIERHDYGTGGYPGQLVLQDALTLHGAQFRNAAVIVASPPCQRYSYMAMPFSRGKAQAAAIRADASGAMLADLNALFNACFRIQREACEAAGRHIPMVVENVRGAQPWVGRAAWSFGSFYLWGDVPALMPTARAIKIGVGDGYQRNQRPHLTNPAEQTGKPGHARKAASAQIAKIPFALFELDRPRLRPAEGSSRNESAIQRNEQRTPRSVRSLSLGFSAPRQTLH